MALIRFTKLPKHQQYEYKPRYWDPRKEELKERLERAEKAKENDVEAVKSRLSSGGLRRGFSADGRSVRQQQVLRSNLILLGVIAIILFLSYLFLTAYLPRIANAVGGGSTF
jgi:hypothetical protein